MVIVKLCTLQRLPSRDKDERRRHHRVPPLGGNNQKNETKNHKTQTTRNPRITYAPSVEITTKKELPRLNTNRKHLHGQGQMPPPRPPSPSPPPPLPPPRSPQETLSLASHTVHILQKTKVAIPTPRTRPPSRWPTASATASAASVAAIAMDLGEREDQPPRHRTL